MDIHQNTDARDPRGRLLIEPELIVDHKGSWKRGCKEYAIYDQRGHQLGAVCQPGHSFVKEAMRRLSAASDLFMSHRVQIVDLSGDVLLMLNRLPKIDSRTVEGTNSIEEVAGKALAHSTRGWRIVVYDPAGREIGQVIQQRVIGKIRFGLVSSGYQWGSLSAESWRSLSLNVQDHTGTEVIRITKAHGEFATTRPMTAGNYVVQVHRPLEDPLASLAVGATLAIVTALKREARFLAY